MLGNLIVFHPPQVIVAGGFPAVGALTHRQDEITLGQDHVGLVIDHLDPLLGQGGQSLVQAGDAVGEGGVVLDIGVPVEVVGGLVGVVALHHIVEEVLHQGAVGLGLVQVGDLGGAVDLGVAGGVGVSGQGGQVVPVLGNFAVLVEAEDVEGYLFPGAGEVVDGVQTIRAEVYSEKEI